MVGKRDCIENIIDYLRTLNIEVNVAKNNARGNKGFFSANGFSYRIDISKKIESDEILSVLAHEFAHYVHYSYDKKLDSLDFIFEDFDDELLEELISVTVDLIPKDSIKPLFERKENYKSEIKFLTSELNKMVEKSSFENLERKIKKSSLKYLLKYDKVKVFEGFQIKIYSVEDLDNNSSENIYLKLKAKQRALKRLNSKINRMNKYYNSFTELFARSFQMYVTDKRMLQLKAPKVYNNYIKTIETNKIPMLNNFVKFL